MNIELNKRLKGQKTRLENYTASFIFVFPFHDMEERSRDTAVLYASAELSVRENTLFVVFNSENYKLSWRDIKKLRYFISKLT
jgi:hypothetical protein